MTRLRMFQVDAFANEVFRGNPAAVVPLETWLDDALMQSIAAENNLSETAFFVREGEAYKLRWFTPRAEVDLCGHATLASAYVLFTQLGFEGETAEFDTRSGRLSVSREGDLFVMDFPAYPPTACEDVPEALLRGLGVTPERVLCNQDDYFAIYPDEETVQHLRPDFGTLEQLEVRGTVITAPGKNADFVSRFFVPRLGIPEDPVTGSIHTTLVPYWAERLGKTDLHARQLSARGGDLYCALRGDRVSIGGPAVLYLDGTIIV